MSLKYVTKKLEDQSLEEEEAVNNPKECQVDDSGTESDDENENDKDDLDDIESEDGDLNLDSGVSLNLRSGMTRDTRGRTKQLPTIPRQPPAPAPAPEILPQMNLSLVTTDDTDNHSSEEELEDIIGASHKSYSEVNVASGPGSLSIKSGGAGGTSTNTEKRKWSEANSSGDDRRSTSTSQCVIRAGSGSSGDEEVSGLLDGASSYTPVQFCTSPPLDVYKPRKSQSPPPKLFHMSGNGQVSGPFRQHSFDSNRNKEGQRPSGAFLPRPRPRLLRPVEFCSLPTRQEAGDFLEDADVGKDEPDPGHRSPNKRHRSTPKPQNIQRPCLDFEKMQQIKTKVVTSWRQGAELSLFCW